MQPILRFGRVEVRTLQRELLVDGASVAVGARAFDVLLALVAQRGELVTKEALLDAVWTGRVVEDNNLVVQIGVLRKALGKGAIVTIPGQGYRFCLAPSGPAETTPVATPERPTDTAGALIGRDDDLAAIGRLMDAEPLVTIAGAGGIGKTRIADSLRASRQSRHAHGAVWVELAGVAASDLLVGSIAGAAHLSVGGGDDAIGKLVAALSPLDLLLVLDNAEHLVPGIVPIVAALMAGAPRLRLLVTSQAPLRAAGECVYRLDGLAVAHGSASYDDAIRQGAVALFIARARAQDRSLLVDASLLEPIVTICSGLEGVPLAIELAAARVAMFGIRALAGALRDRLQWLTRGRQDAPERQRTLRAALAWSYGLLDPQEAALFRRLAVFSGAFTFEMARIVGGVDDAVSGSGAWQGVDALGGLVDRSLVGVDPADEPRYRLPESARCFALEMLEASGEAERAAERHAVAVRRHFAAIYDACRDGGMRVDRALVALEPYLDGGRVALAWMMRQGSAADAVALAPALSFALTLSRHRERTEVWETTARCIEDARVPDPARAAWALGYAVYSFQRNPEAAVAWAERALATVDDAAWRYRALAALAMALARLGDVARCASTCAEMDAIELPSWPARMRFPGAMANWQLATARGDFDAALAANRRAHGLAVACGDDANVESLLVSMVDIELATGRSADAVEHGLELERRLARGRHVQALTVTRINLVGALLAEGRVEQARRMAAVAWPPAVAFEVHPILADNLALLAASSGDWPAAARLHGYADAARAATDTMREANECRAIARVEALARPMLGSAYEGAYAEGARLGRDEVPAVAGIAPP